uniref:Uncharacterized protein n=1 Tax=viral metagenome TaxID=1070528 RepID=A0A6C0HS23_9ZZZZ
MNSQEKLLLQEMIQANNVEDQTQTIRSLKHSVLLKNDITKLLDIMKNTDDQSEIHIEAMMECNFLFTYYTDIYNRIRKSEINIDLFYQFLGILSKIEDGEIDQHEGSFEVGTILKKIYVDSALKRSENLDKKYNNEQIDCIKKDIGWKKYKSIL